MGQHGPRKQTSENSNVRGKGGIYYVPCVTPNKQTLIICIIS
jgi:hypothetical protein